MFNDGVQAAKYPAHRGIESFAALSGVSKSKLASAAFCAVTNSIGEKAIAKP
jgi:hypothetical protein